MVPFIVLLLILALIVFLIATNIKIVPQSEKWVIERLGTYYSSWDAGLHLKAPFIDRIAMKVSTKEKVFDFPPQPVITKDNATIQIDTVVYSKVTDAKLYTYGTENPLSAIENLTATTLRNIIGDLELDKTLTSRHEINEKMRLELDEATDPWGIKVIRVEIKTIQPPKDIQDAMERQMKAERERRAKILEAEGNKKSAILNAEGQKEARILNAEATKEATLLEAEALKAKKIKEAEGEADALVKTQTAYAKSLKILNDANPTQAVLTLKGYEAMAKVADGNATKLILPSELAGLGSVFAAMGECANLTHHSKGQEDISKKYTTKHRKNEKKETPSLFDVMNEETMNQQ